MFKVFGVYTFQKMQLPFYEDDGSKSLTEMLALKGQWRDDSIIMSIRDRLAKKNAETLTKTESMILVIEGLEDLVNMDGFEGFFEIMPSAVEPAIDYLKEIGCPNAAAIVEDAVKATGVEQSDPTGLHNASATTEFTDFDQAFQAYPEPIVERLLDYVIAHHDDIHLDPAQKPKGFLQRLFGKS